MSRTDEKADFTVEVSPELAAAASGFTVQLPAFEGPLDLLLHLIREHKLDIFDIPIAFVTERYLEHLSLMRELNLDIAGEFLVMAATLAHIKSRMLLPRPETPAEDGSEDAVDPRSELVKRLLEHQKYLAAAEDLARQDLLGRDVFVRPARTEQAVPLEEVNLREVSVFKLIEAFDRILASLEPEKQHEVRVERVSISDAISRIAEKLRGVGQTTFLSLFEGVVERHRIIATFLGLLEMVRLELVRVVQGEGADGEGDILILATDRLGDGGEGDHRDDFR